MARLTIDANNNPGALEDSDFTRSQPGYVGGGGRFAKFQTPEHGIRAQEALLSGKTYFGGGLTVEQALNRYTPPNKENPPEARANYLNYIAKAAGVDPRKPVPREKVPAVARAMREFETGRGKRSVTQVTGASAPKPSFTDDIAAGLGISVEAPSDNDRASIDQRQAFDVANAGSLDKTELKRRGAEVVTTTDAVTSFIKGAIQPLIEKSQGIVAETEAVTATKHAVADDISSRGNALMERMRPYQERRNAIIQRLEEVEAMSPLQRKLKSTFNSDYDVRVLEGRLAKIDDRIGAFGKEFDELSKVKGAIATASIAADAADIDSLQAQAGHIEGEAKLLGTVASAVRNSADIMMYPLQQQAAVLQAETTQKNHLLGNMTTEYLTDAVARAGNSPTGTIEVDGLTFTVGELQGQAQAAQSRDLSFRNLVNATSANDLQQRDRVESDLIDHMNPTEIDEALKNGGVYKGQQLSISKLASAVSTNLALKGAQVGQVNQDTVVATAADQFRSFATGIRQTNQRSIDMFGSQPQELQAFGAQLQIELKQFEAGRIAADQRGVREEYIATYMPRLQAMQKDYDARITTIAKRWGGNKPELQAVAESYLRGAPLSGDAAVNGMVIMARSGLPAGVKLEGPAAAAYEAARAVVMDWDQPNNPSSAGASFESLLSPQSKKPEDLKRKVQQAVNAVYGANLTDQLIRGLPQMAASIRDENSPDKRHPFARVSPQEFQEAVRHGDNEGYAMISQQLGISAVQAMKMFRDGPDSKIWQQVMVAKKLQPAQFSDFQAATQAAQMTGLLQALDAGPSARDGFKPGAAFVDFMKSKEVSGKVDQLVNAYGQSGFGAHLVSSTAGGGYREGWNAYGAGLEATYSQLNSANLRRSIAQQRAAFSDPYKRMNVVLGAAGLTPDERTVLGRGIREAVGVPNVSQAELMGTRNPAMIKALSSGSFDKLSYVVQNHKFDDPQMERIRRKAAARWDEMNSVVGLISDSME